MGKRGNPIPYPLQQGPSKSIAFVPVERTVSLLEADFSICSSKFASFNPSPFLVPLPSYGSLLSLPMNHVSMTTPRTSVERERPEREREDSFVRCPRHSRGLVAWFKQFEASSLLLRLRDRARGERGERREERGETPFPDPEAAGQRAASRRNPRCQTVGALGGEKRRGEGGEGRGNNNTVTVTNSWSSVPRVLPSLEVVEAPSPVLFVFHSSPPLPFPWLPGRSPQLLRPVVLW